jgi:hypothetical protein
MDLVIMSQQNALDVLREESEELYMEAIQPDASLVPFRCSGPTRTPPIPGHLGSILQNSISVETFSDNFASSGRGSAQNQGI